MLLGAGPEVGATDHFGATPLHLAAATSAKVTEQILTTGVAPTAKDDFGCTPLLAAVRAGRPDAVASLLSHGADPAVADAYGATALVIAQREGLPSIVELLRHTIESQQQQSSNAAVEQAPGGH